MADDDIEYGNSMHFDRPRSDSSATYVSSNELPSLEAKIAQAVRSDREEQKMKVEKEGVRLASALKRVRSLPGPRYALPTEEIRQEIPRRTHTWTSRPPSRCASVSSGLGYIPSQIQRVPWEQGSMPQTSGRMLDDAQEGHKYEYVHHHFHHLVLARAAGKGPISINRNANGDLQFERCLEGKSHAR